MPRPDRRFLPSAPSLEPRVAPVGLWMFAPCPIVYSDPTAPPAPDPGPYPGDDVPPDYPTPVPGGPIGPGAMLGH